MSLRERLAAACTAGKVRELDLALAHHVAQVSGDDSEALALAVALTSAATGEGHVCIALDEWAGRGASDAGIDTPPLDAWRAALRASPAVGAPGEFRPLILDAADRLYLGRYFEFEQSTAGHLIALAEDLPAADPETLAADLARHFTRRDPGDRQRLAAALALQRRLLVIAGGPGTGKTTTVARILALMVEREGRLRIALAAPTGKAAARLTESLRHHLAALPPATAALLPQEATTLHRLLGVLPDTGGFRHHAGNPLHLDLLVVDEVSMVDLPLMARLLAALPPHARLLLLGDPEQLASVEAGSVLGDICNRPAGSPGCSPALARRLAALDLTPPAVAEAPPPLADSLVVLEASHRFGAESGIGALARAVNRGDAQAALAVCADERFEDAEWHDLDADLPALIAAQAVAGFGAYLGCTEPGDALAAFNRFRFLCALREGPFGVAEVNRIAEQALRARGLLRGGERHYPGRPLLITRNDYTLKLYNGDVGLMLPDPEAQGRLRAFFATPDGGVRRVLINRLPEHETVFAMTVHKSQGSEFDRCALILPGEENRVLTRELIYTAITRARRSVLLIGDPCVFAAGCAATVRRASGLQDRLWLV